MVKGRTLELVFNISLTSISEEIIVRKKKLKSIEPFTSGPKDNPKFCINCGARATKLAAYNTEGAVILERYCDKCSREIGST